MNLVKYAITWNGKEWICPEELWDFLNIIDSDGLLTIAEDEDVTSIVVTATSTGDNTNTATGTYTIVPAPAESNSDSR